MCDIRPIDVRGWHGDLPRGPLHQNTIAKIYRLFRTIMSTAVEDELLHEPGQDQGRVVRAAPRAPALTCDDVPPGRCDRAPVPRIGVDGHDLGAAVR